MKFYLLLISILVWSSMGCSQANYSRETLEKIKEVENNITGNLVLNEERPATIAERMVKYKVKGMSIAVIHDFKIDWAKGYGWADEAEKRPVTTETLFEPGSISKTLNAIGILRLAQDKKLDLFTDINTYLTSWKFPYDSLAKGKIITLADILSHTAGLSVHGFPGHNMNGPVPTVYQVLDGVSPAVTPAVRSEFEPGLQFQYSGGGTTISQVILTDITHQPYEVWMDENILKPMGMVHSTYAQPPTKEKQQLCSTAYLRDGTPVENKFHVYPEQAAAGLWMTPSDLCRYIIDIQLAYQGATSKVLNSDMVKLHLTPYHNESAAMGTFIEDHEGAMYFQHSAGNDGFCGQFYGSLEDGNGVVIFLNNDDGRLIFEVLNSVAKAYQWKNFYREPRRRTSIDVPDSVVKTYEGLYLFDDTWAGIGKTDNEYYFYTGGTYAKMYFVTPILFFNEEFPSDKEFIKDDKGKVTGYTRTVGSKPYPNATKVINPDSLHIESRMFGEMGWYLFEIKKYDESISYYKRGLQLNPADLNSLSNLAHTYLYSGDEKNAMAIYKAHLKDDVRPGYSWEHMMQDDLVYFKEHGYDIKVFDKVFAELKIKKPEGY